MNRDDELDELFSHDPELGAVAQRLRAARPAPELDQRFERQLRGRLMAQAAEQLRPRRSRWWRMPTGLAWAGATGGALAAAAVLINLVNSHPHDQVTFVTASSPLTGQPAVTADLITVSFTEPMDHSAVVAGLHIQPATAVRATWQGNQLVIAPLHHLAPNTPYTVTIDEASARAAGGGVVRGGVRIAFGTAPKPAPPPPPAQAGPPALALTPIGQVGDPSRILFGPGGSLIATHGIAAVATPAPTPTPAPGAAAPATPPAPTATPSPPATSPSAAQRPAATANPAATPPAVPVPAVPATPSPSGPSLVVITPDGTARAIGRPATTATLSADGKHIASAVAGAGGGADIVIGQPDSAAGAVVAHSDTLSTDLAWSPGDRVLFVSGGEINSVGLDGSVQAVMPVPTGAPVLLGAGGLSAIELPAPGSPAAGALVDLVSKAGRELRGSQSVAAYSPDGGTIAWLDAGAGAVMVSPAAQDQPVSVPLQPAATPPTALAVSNDAGRLALTAAVTSVLQVSSGQVLGTAAGTNAAFSPTGDRLAVVTPGASPATFGIATAPLPAVPTTGAAPAPVPTAAAALLDRFVQAQVHGDAATLGGLSTSDPSIVQRTPRGLTRSNVTTATTRDDGTITAIIELIADPSPVHGASLTTETLTLAPGGADGYSIAAAAIPTLAEQPPGPHVVSLQPDARDAAVVDVSFDSDLAPATVPPAVSLRTHDGKAVAATVSYNADTRTATVTPNVRATGEVEVVIAPTLTDISGQHLATPFTATFRRS